ncbi:hypothetical protein V8G54_032556 [Vigna mungo]|uniref:Integrase catalytic domain-containing protein n=1 Tax=Vigna mungo TaxID=3915 RepID=A0AAQ3RFE8_VIGMU
MAMDEGKMKIERFDGADFGFWKMQIEDYLYQKGMQEPLTCKKPEAMKEEELSEPTLSRNVAFNTANEKTTASLMAALSSMYEKPSAANKVNLMRRLFNLRMTEDASTAQHINELNTITIQLSSVGINFDEEVRALILLSSLPESWNATVTTSSVKKSVGERRVNQQPLQYCIQSQEVEVQPEEPDAADQRRGNPNLEIIKALTNRKLSNVGIVGRLEVKDETNVATTSGGGDALICSLKNKEESWVLDSGASFHATSQKELFENYVPGNLGKVYLGNEQSCEIIGKGMVKIKLNGSVWELKNVRHIPDLTKNLISVGQLASEGYTTIFHGDDWKISKGAMTIARGKKSGTLYKTAGACHLIAVAANENPNLWHQRLGHVSEKGMKIMHSKGKLPGLQSVEIDMCEDCILGKQKRVSFQTSRRTPKKDKLELIHSDVWGPTTVPSVGGKQYFVTFIDDHSRKVWVYFLKHKSEVFKAFKIWKAMVENETGLKIKKLRSDNGGEYVDTRFKKFCHEHGIRMERTVPGTPQHNGVAERMNRSLTERARSMRVQSGLPKQFWAEAVNTAAYLINRSPSVPLEHKIPEEVWSGKEVKLSHLRVFGCVAYVHISDQVRNKHDPKSKKCTFLGYGEDEFGYRIWDDENKKDDPQQRFYAEVEDILESPILRTPQPEESNEANNEQSEPHTPTLVLRRSSRPHVPNGRYIDYMLLTDGGEPEDYMEACQTTDADKWELAMKDEIKSLISNQTWELVELPMGKKALHNKWVYRVKEDHDGFQQKEGVDYTKIFAPVVKLNTIRTVLSIVTTEDLYLEQLDVKTTFLHGDLDEEIYMHQPEGFSKGKKKNMVCKLKKSLYGLKQAPRQWYRKFESFMHKEGFQKCNVDHCRFFKRYRSSYVILLLYVDDMLVAGSDMTDIRNLKMQLSKEFDMKDLGPAKKILGMQITRDKQKGVLQLSQAQYINHVLQRFNMEKAKPVSTPLASHFRLSKDQSPQTKEEEEIMAKIPYASAIGSLMYAMVCTRPNIGYAVGVVSRFMSKPGKARWEAVKWILRYL